MGQGYERELLFRRIQDSNRCDVVECSNVLSGHCACMDDFEATIRSDALEAAALIAEGLNGWGSAPAPELAEHIAKVIRDIAQTDTPTPRRLGGKGAGGASRGNATGHLHDGGALQHE